MSKELFSSGKRMRLSWIACVLAGALVAFTGSAWEDRPLFGAGLYLAGCVLVGVGSMGRLWCMLYVAGFKNKVLVTVGPYSICRNPLYFFSLLGGVGLGLATKTLLFPLGMAVLFGLYYPSVIRREEGLLRGFFGEEFETYRRSTPSFFPRLSLLVEPDDYGVHPRIFRRHIGSALWFVWLLGAMEVLAALHKAGYVRVFFRVP